MENESVKYEHTQIGRLMIIILVAMVLFFWYILAQASFDKRVLFLMLPILLLILSFVTLKVIINKNYIKLKFGYGIFWKRFPLKEIVSAKSVKNHWYYGWGIRIWLWPRMIIFNVSGFDAVEIRMKNGRVYRIGTDKPKALEMAINREIQLVQ